MSSVYWVLPPRNLGFSTYGTGWSFNFSETVSFAVDSVKNVVRLGCVKLQCPALSPAAHPVDSVLDVVDSCRGVFFNALYCKVNCMQGLWHVSWHCGCDVIHVDLEKGRRYYTTLGNTLSQPDLPADHPVYLHSCCSVVPSLNLTCLLIILSTSILAVLLKRKSLSHLGRHVV